MATIQEWLDKGFTPDQAIAAAAQEVKASVATKTVAPKVQPAKAPASAKQALYYIRSLYNASIKGVKNGDPFTMPKGLKDALKAAAVSVTADLPETLAAEQNPAAVSPALTGQVCVWIIKKGARKGLECASNIKVVRIDGSPLCGNHAAATKAIDATAKALNESPDGEGTVQSANVKADKGPETEALL